MSKVDCKVVLLGSSMVGKTCLLARYIHGQFVSKTTTTVGGSFASKKECLDGKKPVILGIWDTAGSERYATMSRMYYRHALAAIVCYSIVDKNSFERARYWISELLATEEVLQSPGDIQISRRDIAECKIYLCGTKLDIVSDDPSRRQITKEDARTLADGFLFSKIAKDFITVHGAPESQVKGRGAFQESIKLPTKWSDDPSKVKRKSGCCHS